MSEKECICCGEIGDHGNVGKHSMCFECYLDTKRGPKAVRQATRIAKLEAELDKAELAYNTALARLAAVEKLPRFNNIAGKKNRLTRFGVTGHMTEHPEGLWLRRLEVEAALKE